MYRLLRAAAERWPDRPLVVSDRGDVSYAQLHDRALRVAGGLAAAGFSRCAALTPHAEDALALLAGAAAAGVQVCLYPLQDATAELADLTDRFDHRHVYVGEGWDGTPPTGAMPLNALRAGDPLAAPAATDDATVLILTTGTTGARRGAIHLWSRLVGEPVGPTASAVAPARWLLSYNLPQFAGMAILLQVLRSGATLVQPAQPRAREGLAAIRAHRATHVSATPTFWRSLLRELGPSEPDFALEQITLGGEAVPDRLLADLQGRFPSARVSQIYAATELGQTGSVRDGRPGLPASVLDRPADAAVRYRVVDGELQVNTREGMLGYYGEPPLEAGSWRPTGDLVEVRDDRLLFVGRSSEVINVGGVKVHPLSVERVAERVPGVEAACAYGRANPVVGQIVALDLVVAAGADADATVAAVREACTDLAPAARPRSIRTVAELVSRGQKVNRRLSAEVPS